jgi:heptosyltransferase-1
MAGALDVHLKHFLIVRLSSMGDVIHTLPAVQALRNAFPESNIGWIIEERWAELLCAPGTPLRGPRSAQRPLVDWVHTVNLVGWRRSLFEISTVQNIAKVWNDVRAAHYGVAVDLQGAMRSALLARWSGARAVYGAAEPRESPASLWYTRQAIASGAHVIEQNLSVAEAVVRCETSLPVVIPNPIVIPSEARNLGFAGATGMLAQGNPPAPRVELPRDRDAEERINQHLAEKNIADFAILNPGAGWGAKRWPAERYGQVARQLTSLGVRTIFNYGPGEEALALAAQAASSGDETSKSEIMPAEMMNCTIGELIALTRRARLFIGGDTGPLHLAAALGVPVVAIFGPTDPARNGPYGTRSIVLRSRSSATSHSRSSQPDQGLLEIGTDAVVAAARELLRTEHFSPGARAAGTRS